jgi:hypothetical protein
MRYEDFREGDKFVIAYRTDQHGTGCWHWVAEHTNAIEAETLYDHIIAKDVGDGAPVGSRWRISHIREFEIIAVLDDRRLGKSGVEPYKEVSQ